MERGEIIMGIGSIFDTDCFKYISLDREGNIQSEIDYQNGNNRMNNLFINIFEIPTR